MIDAAIVESLPTGPGQRHRQVFELARALKAIPQVADADPGELTEYVKRWHCLALDAISTKPIEETRIDFLKAWPNVKFPKGTEPMALVFERAKATDLPDVAYQYETPAMRYLVAICRELQRAAGTTPFYLACRTAGKLLGVDHVTANRWLFLLVTDEVLVEVTKGSRVTGKASRYRYTMD